MLLEAVAAPRCAWRARASSAGLGQEEPSASWPWLWPRALALPPPRPQALRAEGEPGTLEYALYYVDGKTGDKVSPWHSIPLRPPGRQYGVYRFICEIPKG